MGRKSLDSDLNRFYGAASTASFSHVHSPSCFETHPPLTIPGTDFVVYGGSCSRPIVKDADVYIGFDYSMNFTARSWPWKTGVEFLFQIPDMGVPASAAEFVKLVNWTAEQIRAGKKVHAGCIGGHGRTGMFLAALVCTMAGEKDAIAYVREHYCAKAVETQSQVKFLADVFGIIPVGGSKHPKIVNGSKKGRNVVASAVSIVAALAGFSIWD